MEEQQEHADNLVASGEVNQISADAAMLLVNFSYGSSEYFVQNVKNLMKFQDYITEYITV